MNDLAKKLLDYHFWGTEQLLKRLNELPTLTWSNEIESVFNSISETFFHMITVDQLWLSRLNGTSLSKIETGHYETLEQFKSDYDFLKDQFIAFLDGKDVMSVVKYSDTKGNQFENTILELIQHITNHGTYHRGNITAMLRQMGYAGASTDYIYYLRSK